MQATWPLACFLSASPMCFPREIGVVLEYILVPPAKLSVRSLELAATHRLTCCSERGDCHFLVVNQKLGNTIG